MKIYLEAELFFLDSPFENRRSRKHIAWKIAYSVLFALLLIKNKTAHHYLLHSAEELVFSLVTKNYVGRI